MNNKLRRFEALILALAMSVSFLSIPVWAADDSEMAADESAAAVSDTSEISEEEAVEAETKDAEEPALSEAELAEEAESLEAEETLDSEAEEESGEAEESVEEEASENEPEDSEETESEALLPQDVIASGNCGTQGDNVTWTLDNAGTLTISGTGKMKQYSNSSRPPWYSAYVNPYKGVGTGKITQIVVEEGITDIGDYSFADCEHVEEVSIAGQSLSVGRYAFYNCKRLPSFSWTGKRIDLGDHSFDSCSSMVSFQNTRAQSGTPSNSFGSYVFKDCTSLNYIQFLTNQLTGIDWTSFEGCSNLETITQSYYSATSPYCMPTGNYGGCLVYYYETSPGANRVIKCPAKLQMGTSGSPFRLGYVNSRRIEQYACYDCDNAVNISILYSVMEIGKSAFENCDYLRIIDLGKLLEAIREQAFAQCVSLESVTFPGSVKTIEKNAFQGCTNLSTVYFRGDAPQLNGAIFSSDMHLTAYYPENNETWTATARDGYGGTITWVAYTPTLTELNKTNYGARLTKSPSSDLGLGNQAMVYTGSAVQPGVGWVRYRVKAGSNKYDKIDLTKNTCYTYSYANNVNVGTAQVVITGCGEYTGSFTEDFYICPAVTAETTTFGYDGKSHRVDISVQGDATLYYSTDTALTFENYQTDGSTNAPARTTVGTTTVYYIAVPNNNPVAATCTSGSTTLVIEKGEQMLNAEISDDSIPIGGYAYITASARAGEISYSSANPGVATVDEDGTVRGVGEGETTITVSAAGTNNYLPAQKKLRVTVLPQQAQVSILDCEIEVQSEVQFTGNPVEASVTVRYNGTPLTKGQDYTLKYTNNTAIGNATVKITGCGTFIGTVTKRFAIVGNTGPVTKPIDSCTVTLLRPELPYNGKAQTPDLVVKDGETILLKNVDYTIQCDTAVGVGTYSVTANGAAGYSGSVTKQFKIVAVAPQLSFASSSVSMKLGDAPFTNPLQAVTDGTLTYSSDQASVATVHSTTGEITIHSVGTTVIHVHAAAGQNYLAGEAAYTLEVTAQAASALTLDSVSYSFGNTATAFGYPEKYNSPLSIYELIFGKTTKAAFWFDRDVSITGGIWRGNCAGFAGTSAILNDSKSGIALSDFNPAAASIAQLTPRNKSQTHNLTVTEYIEALQIAQHTQLFSTEMARNRVYTGKELKKGKKTLNALYETVVSETQAGRPVLLALYQSGGHAVLAYDVQEVSPTVSQILIYDSNWPQQDRRLTISKDSSGDYMEWSYEIGGSYGTWGTDSNSSSIGYVPYSTIKEIWATKGRLQENENVLSINSGSVAIYAGGDKPVATLMQGELSTKLEGIHIVDYLSLDRADTDTVFLSVPVDVYTFQNLDHSVDEFEVSVANTNLGATASTTADSITIAVDDSCNLNCVFIDAGEDDEYSITLNSSFSYDEDNVVVTGRGNGEVMEVSQTRGSINISNCQITSITVDGKEIGQHTIRASAGAGGRISPAGENVVANGEALTFQISPDSGYQIQDVLVDGKSVGAVGSYEFKAVSEDHQISATFKRIQHSIQSSAGAGGAITPDGKKTVSSGDSLSYRIEPKDDYMIQDVVVDGKSVGAVSHYEFTDITADHQISASFQQIQYSITITAGAGGSIAPDGTQTLNRGESLTCRIETLDGYVIQDVLVDGKSVGAVQSYTFSNVTADHQIRAEFAEKAENLITASDIVRTRAKKAQSVKIKAKTTAATALSYQSNHKSVKVSKAGKVTIAKNFVGQALITITAAETAGYRASSKVITVTVNPTGTSLSSVKKKGAGKLAVAWKKNKAVTGYQVCWSLTSNFREANTVTIKKNKTTKTTLSKLVRKKKYFVRIRTYKNVGGKQYYSAWSKSKAVKVG